MKMPTPRAAHQVNMPERSRVFTAILLVVTIFIVGLVIAFVELLNDEARRADEDKTTVFMVAQIETEYLRLLDSLDRFEHSDPAVSRARLRARLEALRRRLPIVLRGPEGAAARRIDGVVAMTEALDRALAETSSLIAGLRPGDEAAYRRVRAALDSADAPIRQAVANTQLKSRWENSDRSSGVHSMVLGIALAFVGMLLGGGSLILMLVREVRRTDRLLRKTIEAEARTTRAETHLIDAIESIPQGVALFDTDDRLIHCNHNYREIVANSLTHPEPGTSFVDLCRAMVEDHRIVDARDDPEAWLRGRVARHRSSRNREDIRLSDGRWISIAERRTRNGDIVSVFADITDVKVREAVLNEARQHAELASRAKSEFLANMSHELRTPLNAIIGFSEMIRDGAFGPIDNPKYVEYAEDIHSSGAHLLELINDILDISKIEAGEVKIHEEEIDIVRIARACLQFVAKRARDNGLVLDCDLPDDLPLLFADACKVKQILVNLLSNAVKFTERGGRVSLRIRLRDDRRIEATISDTGIGIAREDIDLVLKPFTQVDSKLARKYEGTGLGLPLCKSLVDLHGGQFVIESDVGVGTTVRVVFPASRTRSRP